MAKKLSYHLNALTDAAVSSVHKQRDCTGVIKFLTSAINPEIMGQWKHNNPQGKVCVRHYIPHNDPMSVAERVRQLMQHVENCKDVIDIVETPWNEEYQNAHESLDKYTQDTIVATDMIKQQWPEVEVSVGHFSVGNPPDIVRDWEIFAPALQSADILSIHEYGSPFVNSEPNDVGGNKRLMVDNGYPGGWWMLRYRQVYKFLKERGYPTPPLIISECGRDHGLTTGTPRGYKFDAGYGASDLENYANEMRWFLREVARDFYVLGLVIYACGTYPDWETFNIAGTTEFEELVNEDISAPLYQGSIVAHKATKPNLASGGIVVSSSSPQPALAPTLRAKNLYEDWATTPGNMNPKTGPVGLAAFQGHMEELVKINALAPHHTAFELGFPRFEQVQTAPAPTPDPDPPPRDSSVGQMAELLRVDERLLDAIIKVESGGQAFVDGRLILRFEPHIFARQCSKISNDHLQQAQHWFKGTDSWRPAGHKMLVVGQLKPVHANQGSEWEAYRMASQIDEEAAALSCSTGKYQIVGFNFARLGYDNAKQMMDSFAIAEVNQDWGFVSFVLSDGRLLNAMRTKDLRTFVSIYNGPANVDYYMSLLAKYGIA